MPVANPHPTLCRSDSSDIQYINVFIYVFFMFLETDQSQTRQKGEISIANEGLPVSLVKTAPNNNTFFSRERKYQNA